MAETASEGDILEILERDGPQTGAELAERTRMEPLSLWRLCRRCPEIRFEILGRRYLRLDRAVEGYARLSPSIRREFLTYTLLGLASSPELVEQRGAQLGEELARINRFKFDLARQTMESVVADLPDREIILAGACFIIAGDVTYGMAHVVPRPETSTGKMVRGSDLDIIVIGTDDVPEETLKALDEAVYRKKHYLLVHPEHREEIDYVIKRLSRVREQLRFDDFRSMVACKIMLEGQYLCGNESVFRSVKDLVDEHGIAARIAELEAKAIAARDQAERVLLEAGPASAEADYRNLFYTLEEGDEIS
jgi:DNA-binding Lrp family transcriptional regulator